MKNKGAFDGVYNVLYIIYWALVLTALWAIRKG